MPDPRSLRVGDRIRFVAFPDAWSEPGYLVHAEDRAFLRDRIERRRVCRIARLDADGWPWFDGRTVDAEGRTVHHSWGVFESTGWERVRGRRSP